MIVNKFLIFVCISLKILQSRRSHSAGTSISSSIVLAQCWSKTQFWRVPSIISRYFRNFFSASVSSVRRFFYRSPVSKPLNPSFSDKTFASNPALSTFFSWFEFPPPVNLINLIPASVSLWVLFLWGTLLAYSECIFVPQLLFPSFPLIKLPN